MRIARRAADTPAVRRPTTHDYRREALRPGHEIRRFEALSPGRYAVEGVGGGLAVGDRIRFTLKGSESLELILSVRAVEAKLIPTNGWAAELEGEDFRSLDIHRWSIVCDGCGHREAFEFSAPAGASRGALEGAAGARMADIGWSLRGAHRCPACAARGGEV